MRLWDLRVWTRCFPWFESFWIQFWLYCIFCWWLGLISNGNTLFKAGYKRPCSGDWLGTPSEFNTAPHLIVGSQKARLHFPPCSCHSKARKTNTYLSNRSVTGQKTATGAGNRSPHKHVRRSIILPAVGVSSALANVRLSSNPFWKIKSFFCQGTPGFFIPCSPITSRLCSWLLPCLRSIAQSEAGGYTSSFV